MIYNNQAVAKIIKDKRILLCKDNDMYTIKNVARFLDIPYNTYYKYENNLRAIPIEIVIKLCLLYCIDTNIIFNDKNMLDIRKDFYTQYNKVN